MAGKIFAVVGIVILIGIGVFAYHAITHPSSLGLSSLFGASSSSSRGFSLWFSSSSAPKGPASLQPAPPQTTISGPTGIGAAAIDPSQIPAGYTLAQLSPYFHQVRIGMVSAGTNYYYGTITLYSYLNAGESVDVTGWRIQANHNSEYVPKAVNLYDPSGLAPATDVVMHEGDTVFLYSSSAPINLRLNKCIGYDAHIANFTPALPVSCPYVDQAVIRNFSGACQNYINSLGLCQAPNMSDPSVPRNDYACENYLLNNFTYKSCFNAHVTDADFLSNQVWIWTGSNVVDSYHDIVKLLDKNGLLVDIYSY